MSGRESAVLLHGPVLTVSISMSLSPSLCLPLSLLPHTLTYVAPLGLLNLLYDLLPCEEGTVTSCRLPHSITSYHVGPEFKSCHVVTILSKRGVLISPEADTSGKFIDYNGKRLLPECCQKPLHNTSELSTIFLQLLVKCLGEC